MKHEPKLQFEAVRDLDYDGSIGHIVSNRTFDGDEGIEVLTDDFNKLWNRGFYYDEAEIIVRHLNAALDEMNALGTQSYFESGIKGYFLGEPIDRPSNDPCTSPECLAAYIGRVERGQGNR